MSSDPISKKTKKRGRLERGFDFLGIQFTGRGERSPSAVSIARHTEKTTRLYEQGASRERIETYKQNRQRYLRGILGDAAPVTKKSKEHSSTALHTPKIRPNVKPTLAPAVLFSRDHSLHPKSEMEDNNNRQRKHNENKTKQIGELLCNTRSSSS